MATRQQHLNIRATSAALALIQQLIEKYGPSLMFYQSSARFGRDKPMCYPKRGFKFGRHDLMVGEVSKLPFYVARTQAGHLPNGDIVLDAEPGKGAVFSLENGSGHCFITHHEAHAK